VLLATAGATALAIPLGVAAVRRPTLGRFILAVTGVLQTIPSLALFGFLIPLPWIGGIGARTAIIALLLYALLPIVRATVTGSTGVDPAVRDASLAMGMTSRQRLFLVELPLALPVIVSGLRVATATAVGVATVAAAIGAGGLGSYIFRGLRMYDTGLLLRGAVPAALLAIALDVALGLLATSLDARVRGGRSRVRGIVAVTVAFIVAVVAAGTWAGRAKSRSGAVGARTVRVGSKDFTEQRILGELLAQTLESAGVRVERHFELGGSLCHQALAAAEIDAYPEYTGTSYTAILKHEAGPSPRVVHEQVRREYRQRFGFEISDPLGFRNDFAILVRRDTATSLGLRTLSDVAARASELRAAFGPDFLARANGFPGLAARYGIHFSRAPREIDLSLAFHALTSSEVDLIASNSTEGLIERLNLVQLEDDRHWFPPYEAVFVVRADVLAQVPALAVALSSLTGRISTETMRRLNLQVDGDRQPVDRVVARFRESLASSAQVP
jgi:osmoprotectant transport system permease protein